MKAAAYHRFGGFDVVRLEELAEPEAPAQAARVRVEAAALNPKDVLIRKGRMRWMARGPMPRIPGYDVAGTLMDAINGWPVGTPVFGMIQSQRGGACAEVAVLAADEMAKRPECLSASEAAGLPLAGLTALQGLRDELELKPGAHVLLNGASGGVGTLAVQIAKALGAQVTAVCSARNAELVQSLGADEAVDYSQVDIASLRGFDAVYDIYGNLGWAQGQRMLTSGGRFCTTVPRAGSVARGILRRLKLHRAALVIVQSRRRDLELLAEWVSQEKLRPVVDLTIPLARSHEGHERLETRRARGKVIVEVA